MNQNTTIEKDKLDSTCKQIVHFAHANGFPSASYNTLFSNLPDNIKLIALDKFAHNKQYPLLDNWHNQVDEFIAYIEDNSQKGQKIYAIGHSFGAVISYMGVCKRPDLFSGLIMLDPPLITGVYAQLFRLAKKTSLIDKMTPAGITQGRVKSWPLQQDLAEYFSKKALFKDFDKASLRDYIKAGIIKDKAQQHLVFDPIVEANIFRTLPHNLHQYKKRLRVQTTLITGKSTSVCTPRLIRPFLSTHPEVVHIQMQGGHMFPFEYPKQLSELIAQILNTQNIMA